MAIHVPPMIHANIGSMETIIEAHSRLTPLDVPVTLVAGAVFIAAVLVMVFLLVKRSSDHTLVPIVVAALILSAFIGGAALITADSEHAEDSRAAAIAAIEEDNDVSALVPVKGRLALCSEGSSAGAAVYVWKTATEPATLQKGTLMVEAEKDGSCTYQLFTEDRTAKN